MASISRPSPSALTPASVSTRPVVTPDNIAAERFYAQPVTVNLQDPGRPDASVEITLDGEGFQFWADTASGPILPDDSGVLQISGLLPAQIVVHASRPGRADRR